MHYGPKHKRCGTPTIAIANIANEAKQLDLAQSDSDLLWTRVDQQPQGPSYPTTHTHIYMKRRWSFTPYLLPRPRGTACPLHASHWPRWWCYCPPQPAADGPEGHKSHRHVTCRHVQREREREREAGNVRWLILTLSVCVCVCVCVCVRLWPISLVGLIREPIFE